MELADGGVAGGAHLAVGVGVERRGRVSGVCRSASASISSRQAQKSPPPARPRSARWNVWLCALTKPGQRDGLGHAPDPILVEAMASRAVPAPLAQLPNALTVLRLALIPLFIVALRQRRRRLELGGRLDLPRRRRDRPGRRLPRAPLARRVAVRQGRRPARRPADDRLRRDPALRSRASCPGAGRVIIVLRDVLLVAGYRLLMPRGYELNVTHARQGRDLAALPLGRDPASSPARGPSGRSGSSGSRSGSRSPRRRSTWSRRVARWRREGGRHGRRRGDAAAAAHLEPAEADGADRRQAVHRAHPRAAARARLRRGRDHARVHAAGDPELLRRRRVARREHRVLGRGAAARHRRLGPPRERASSTRPSSSSPATRSATSTSARSSTGTRRTGAAVTIGLKSVDNPLEFGIVVTDEDGKVERFLEKPSWGQVFSDTINTGIYVLEPEVLTHIPADGPYDFSKELFPLLLEMGRPIYGHVMDGYWQDIGNLDQYRQANFDALDEKVRLNIAGVRLRGNVWIGEGADIHDVEEIEGPAFIGNHCRIARDASIGPYTVLSNGVTLRERARTVALRDRRVHPRRPERADRGRDRRPLLRHPRPRPHPGGRRDRRRGHDRLRVEHHAARPDLPLQGGRDRLAALREPDLGDAGVVAAVRQGRRHRASSTST